MTTENNNLIKTIVIGWNVLLASLNQMNENAQKIMDNTTATYVFTFVFNFECFISRFWCCEFIS